MAHRPTPSALSLGARDDSSFDATAQATAPRPNHYVGVLAFVKIGNVASSIARECAARCSADSADTHRHRVAYGTAHHVAPHAQHRNSAIGIAPGRVAARPTGRPKPIEAPTQTDRTWREQFAAKHGCHTSRRCPVTAHQAHHNAYTVPAASCDHHQFGHVLENGVTQLHRAPIGAARRAGQRACRCICNRFANLSSTDRLPSDLECAVPFSEGAALLVLPTQAASPTPERTSPASHASRSSRR
jgi:hypothetical protein